MRKGILRHNFGKAVLNFKQTGSIKLLLLTCMLAFFQQYSYGQTTAGYNFTRTTGGYTSISGTGTLAPNMMDDDNIEIGIPIGFTFNFCGTNYTTCGGNSNGVLSLSNNYATCCGITSGFISGGGWIMGMWYDDDGRINGGGTPTAYYETTGPVGSRVFTMEWSDFGVYSLNPYHMNWQIKLYEGSNVIQLCYGSFGSSPSGTIGIANSTSDYLTLPSSGSSTCNSSFNYTTAPASGSILTFSPVVPTAPVYSLGDPQYLTVCQNSSSNSIDALLSTYDPNPGETLTWSVSVAPSNGSVTTGGTQTSTGGTVVPTGFSYTPLPGFTGSDAFTIEVSDGVTGSSSMTIIVTVNPAPAAITGTTTVCKGATTTLSDATSGGTWTSGNPAVATVVAGTGVVTGVGSGTTDITYTLGGCYSTTTVTVIGVPAITSLSSYVAAPGTSITISGNDFNASTTNNYVYFGATRATVTSASETSLSVTVPDDGTYMPIISVENNACAFTGYSKYPFLSTYNNTGFVANTVNMATPSTLATGNFPNGVVLGDIDGDGKADVIGVNNTDGTIYVFRNTSSSGTISFASAVTFTAGAGDYRLAVGDVDGDGKLDIVTPNRSANTLSVFRNTSTSGSISFAGAVSVGTPSGPGSVVIGDIDGDGRADLICSDQFSNQVSVFRNTGSVGSLSFAGAVNLAALASAYHVQIGDLDGDGKPDIATSYYTASNNMSVFRNTSVPGTISFAGRQDFATDAQPNSIGMSDLDGDGMLDVITANQSGHDLSIFRNTSSPGSISFASRADIAAGVNVVLLSTADFDGDGKPDLSVGQTFPNSMTIYSNTSSVGAISLASGVSFAMPSGAGAIAAGDLDGDGKADVAVTMQFTNQISFYRNNPLQSITGGLTVCPGTSVTLSDATTGGTWSSSNTGIATVGSSTGVVTGVAVGTVTITYAGTAGPSYTGNVTTVTVTVTALPAAITGVTNVCTGATTTLASTTVGGTWSSSNTAVATVGSATGVVSGITAGMADITYTVSTGCYVTATVTVNQAPTGISGTFSVCLGLTSTLTDGYSGGTWTSSAAGIASVGSSTGVVTGVAAGNATITYTMPGNCYVTQQVTVNTNPAAITGTPVVCVGSTVTLADATTGGLFSSSSVGVATIGGGTGLVTGISAGTTTISYTITATGCYAVQPLTVNPLPAAISFSSGSGSVTYSYTGSVQTFTAPAGVTSVSVDVQGASGGNNSDYPGGGWPSPGGKGGRVVCSLAVTPGVVYYINVGGAGSVGTPSVGGAGGWNGGGQAGTAFGAYGGGGGGGASDIRLVNGDLTSRVIVAGGAGGAGLDYNNGSWGGDGGGTTAQNGEGAYSYAYPSSNGNGGGGSPSAGGGGGNYPAYGVAAAGTFGNGASANLSYPGGGGGGGYYGGGGGVWDGAGGGSSYTDPALASGVTHTPGFTTGNGVVTISYTLPAGSSSICAGTTTTYTDATSGGTWTSSNTGVATVGSATGVISGISAGVATITYTLPTGCYATKDITVNANPVAITGTPVVCAGLTTTLINTTGTGAWSSSNTALATIGSVSGVVTGVSAGTPTITYLLPTGCYSTVVVTVNPLPAAIGGTLTACPGTTTTLTDATVGGVWTSNNTSVATIGSGTGIVTGVAAGTSTITYTLGTGCIMTANVTINPLPAAITGNIPVCIGYSVTMASGTGGGTWSSSNPALASVGASTGVVTGVSGGNPVITYSLGTGCIVTTTATVNSVPADITFTGQSIINLFAGTGGGYSGDGGLATAAGISGPVGIAVDGSGNVYIAGNGENRVRKIDPYGVITTYAGTGAAGFSGDGGPATAAKFSGDIWGTAVDASGNLYVADASGARIRKISPSGVITTFAGGGGSLGDGGPATAAALNYPTGVAVDAGGNVYIADPGASKVRKVNNAGIITTLAGNGIYAFAGDGGPATAASFRDPYNVAVDMSGNVYISAYSDNRVRKVTGGIITTFAGNGGYGSAGDGGQATAAQLQGNFAITADGAGNVYIGQYDANNVRKVNALGVISTVAGNGSYSFSGMGGAATSAAIGPSGGLAVDASGNLYINSWDFNRATKVTVIPSVCVGSAITLSDASGTGSWSSSNTGVATVGSGSGVVTGVAQGLANITYTLPTGCFKVTPCSVNPTPVAISGTLSTCVGSTTTLTNAVSGGTWTSSNTAIATVGSSSGVVTGLTTGTVSICYTLPWGSCSVCASVTVNAAAPAITNNNAVSYTPGASTFTVPAGVTSVFVTASGAQGGSNGSGLGGNGGRVQGTLTVSPGQQLYIFVGGQGANYVSTGAAGGSSFGGGEDGGVGGSSNGGAGGGAASDVRTSITGGATSIGSLNSRVFVGGGGGGGNFSCSPRLNGGIGGFPAGGNGVASCSSAPTGGSQTAGGTATCYTSGSTYCGTNGGFGSGGGALFWGGGGGGGYYGGAGSGEASGAGGSSYAGSGTSSVTYSNGVQTGAGSVLISYPAATNSVCVGSTALLTNATAGGTWTSSNPAIASVGSSTGIVTGVSAGTLIFTYTLPTGSCYATLAYTVNASPTANSGPDNVCQGATVTLSNGVGGGTWSSSNANATVGSSTGIVSGVTPGTVTITYTLPSGCSSSTAMTVNSLPVPITGLSTVCTGQSNTLLDGTAGGTWTSSNTAFATVGSSSGTVTGVSVGVVTITYTTNPGSCYVTFPVTVNQTPLPIVGSTNICIGVNTTYTDGIGGGTWSSSNSGLASIGSATGIATGVALGTPVISYTLPAGCYATLQTTVNTQPAAITGAATVCEGLTTTLTDATGGGTWSSSNTGTATIGSSSGVVTGISAGTVTMTYTLSGGCTSTMAMTVNPTPAAITGTAVVCATQTTNLSDATTGGVWSSSNTALATVGSTTGVVTGVAAGNPSIIYTLPAGCTASVVLTVNALPTLFSMTGGGSICAGAPGLHIGLSGSVAGTTTYQLYRGTTPVGSAVTGTGSALDFGVFTTAGTYTVIANVTATGCSTTMTGSSSIFINPLPVTFNVSGGGAYCAGGAGLHVYLSGSATFGFTYQLYIGGSTTVGSPVVGTGTLIDFGLQTAGGTYTVVATNSTTGCTNTMVGSAVITVNPLPNGAYTVTGGGGYCAGGIGVHVGVSSSDVGINYQLYNSGIAVGSPLPGTGAAIDFGYKTAAGTYTVVGTNNTTGCVNNMTGSVTITINPLPTVFSVTGGGGYCAGGTGVHVFLSGSVVGTNYQLLLGGVPVGGTVAGTGSSLDFGVFTTAGNYTVSATTVATSCTNTMSGSATVTVNPLPTVFNVTGGGAYCAGDPGVHIGLSGSSVGVSYQLYFGVATSGGPVPGTGGAIDFGLLTAAGTYTVTATDATTTCVNGMTGSALVTINPLPDNTFTVTGGGGYCVGGLGVPVGLSSSASGINYQLYNGISTVGVTVPGTGAALAFGNQLTAGTYTVRGTDPITGCNAVMTGSVVVTVNPLPTAYAVTGGGSYCSGGTGVAVGLLSSTIGVDYQLYLDGVATGTTVAGTGSAISFGLQTAAGMYTVGATNSTTTCVNNMSGSVTISINPLPVVYTVTGGGNYCAGGAGVHVGLGNSNIGISYQLYNGATLVGGAMAGINAPLDFGLMTAVGTYTVVATSTTTGCTANMSGSAVVGTNPLPAVFSVTGGGGYCAGDVGVPVKLFSSAVGVNYQLYYGTTPVGAPVAGTGALINFGLQTAAGVYTVKATDATTGCQSNMAGSATVSINPVPGVFVVTGGGSFCAGGAGVHVGVSNSSVGVTYELYLDLVAIDDIPGTGSAIDFGLQTAAGTYTVLATDDITECASNMTGSAVVSINPLPSLFTVSGGGNYCVGGSGVHVGLGGSTIGVNYQLYLGVTPIGTYMPGTGGPLDFGLQTLAGTYTVGATDGATGCTATMTGSAVINIDPLPAAYAVTGGGNYCPGGTGVNVGLLNSDLGVDYQLWVDGVATGAPVAGTGSAIGFGLQTTLGTYTVSANNGVTGCSNNMTGVAVVGLYPLPAVHNVTGGGNYCAGGPGVDVSLDGSDAGITYQLYSAGLPVGSAMPGSGSAISFGLYTPAGGYTVIATNAVTGCVDTMNDSATININPLPADQALTGGGNYCVGGTGMDIALVSSELGVNYQLYNGSTPVGAPIAGTGAGLDFGLYTSAGVYAVTATNTTTLCSVFMTGTDTITINPLPVAYTITGGGAYCAGGTGVNIGLGNSQVGVNYQLYLGTTAVPGIVAGTGSAITFGLQTTAGTYTVKGTNALAGCVNNMTGSATVSVNVLPTAYNVTGGGGNCVGGPGVHIGLSGSSSGVSYQLYNGVTPVGSAMAGTGSALDFGVYASPGTYTIKGTATSTGCVNTMSGSAVVVTNALPVSYIVSGGSSSYCAGGTGIVIYLSGSEVGVSYQLYRGTTPVGLSVAGAGTGIDFGPQTVAGTYTVVATNTVTGCTSNMAGAASVVINPLPSVYAVTGGGSYCTGGAGVVVSLSGSNTGIKYQLYRSGSVTGLPVNGTGSAISFGPQTAIGSYTVVATNVVTGCTNAMSGSATIAASPLPLSFTVTGGGAYCAGGSGLNIGLSNSISGTNYQLFYGSTPASGIVAGTGLPLNFGLYTIAGTYTVQATFATTGCTAAMTGSATIAINDLPTVFSVTGGGNYCPGEAGVTIGLSGSTSGISYQLMHGSSAVGSPIAGTGSAISFGTISGTGTYTVVASNGATLCSRNMAGSATVALNTVPLAFNVTGGGGYCAGASGVVIGLDGSSAGISYQLMNGSIPAGSPVTGTGLPISFGLQTVAGTTYTVVATNTTTGCTNTMTGTTSVVVNPVVVPAVTLTSTYGDTVCTGTLTTYTPVTVNAGSSPSFQWTVNGAPASSGGTYTYSPANGDVVVVTVTSSATCAIPATATNSVTMTVLPKLMPSVDVAALPGTIVCKGTVVNFYATPTNGGTAPAYLWIRNGLHVSTASTYSYIPDNGDIIHCELSSSYVCRLMNTVSSSNITMEVDTAVTPIVNVSVNPGTDVPAGLAVTFTAHLGNTVPFPSYQWFINGVQVPGATLPVYTTPDLIDLDIVSCQVTSGGGCGGTMGAGAATIHIIGVGVHNVTMGGDNIRLIPNPNKGLFSVKGTLGVSTDQEVTLEITNMLGQVIYTSKVLARNGEIDEKIQLSSALANGMYILNLRSEVANKVFHVVIEQ